MKRRFIIIHGCYQNKECCCPTCGWILKSPHNCSNEANHCPSTNTFFQCAPSSAYKNASTHLCANAGISINLINSLLAKATSFKRYRDFYVYLSESIAEGNSFKKSFEFYEKSKTLLPVSVEQLIIAGEQSGSFSETLLKISKTYEEKTDITTKNLTVMLEPILLVIVWLGVVAVAMAVILPIYSLVGGFNG